MPNPKITYFPLLRFTQYGETEFGGLWKPTLDDSCTFDLATKGRITCSRIKQKTMLEQNVAT